MRKADNLPPYRAVVKKSVSLNFLERSGLAQNFSFYHTVCVEDFTPFGNSGYLGGLFESSCSSSMLHVVGRYVGVLISS